ncbi:MAG: hypothetical protein HYX76_15490 [Acidobacteria bacterium]|nr:hypothetical protein [Acidobacteriota bacterium]
MIGIVALVIATVTFAFSWTWADPDLWGHVRFGRDFWQTGAIERPDPYSYLTSNSRWINHEWLTEAVLWQLFANAGAPGLIGFKVLLALAIAALGLRTVRAQGVTLLAAAIWVLALMLLLVPAISSVRPQMFTCVFFAIVVVALQRAEAGSFRMLWLLPPTFVLWANTHGGFLAGLGIMAVWIASDVAARWLRPTSPALALSRPNRLVLLALGASLIATLLNPYGPRLWWFLRTALVSRHDIAEWRAIQLTNPFAWLYLAAVTLVILALTRARRPRPAGSIGMFMCAAVLPLVAVRHLALFGIVTMVVVAPYVADLASETMNALLTVRRSGPTRWRPVFGTTFLATAALIAGASLPSFRCVTVDEDEFPAAAVSLLSESGARGNLAAFFDWGEYVIWHVGPRVRVSVDGRRETLYDDEIYAENMWFTDGVGDWDALLRNHPTDLALVSKQFPAFNLLKQRRDWELVHEDTLSGLFARDSYGALQALRAAAARGALGAAARCFP